MTSAAAELREVMTRHWGYREFRPLQREAMEAVLAGRDSVVVLPTGGGKSLCFQVPALIRPGLAVIVSPLISLMKDQVDTLIGNGVPAALFNSSLEPEAKAAVVAGLRDRRYRLLYVSPERLMGDARDGFLTLLRACDVSFVAIDEAHCISHWGHDFRPEYRQLARLRELFAGVSVHAYTATATARVRRDIVAQLALRQPIEFVGSFDRPNLVYRVLPRAALKRQLGDALARHAGEAGIVYCTSRRAVDALAQWLSQSGVRAVPYHAGLSDGERARHQDAFLDERADIVVATVAFGMGIDRSDVRFVIHAGSPRSVEHYQQEAGRAGRDGLEAECLLIYSAADFMRWRQMLDRNGELTEGNVALLRQMERYATGIGCRHRDLMRVLRRTHDGGELRRMRCLPGGARAGSRPGRPGAEDSVLRRTRRTAFRHRPRDQRAARTSHRTGRRAPTRHPDHLRTAARCVRSGAARLHGAADRARAARAGRG